MKRQLHTKTRNAARPWLLLWLFPLLFFSIGEEALHNHSPLPHFANSQSAENALGLAAASAPLHATDEACAACQWAAHPAALSAAPMTTTLAQLASVSSSAGKSAIFSGPIERDARGPPFFLSFRTRTDSTRKRSVRNEKDPRNGIHPD